MALTTLDPVTHFLKSVGLQPEVAYFEKSDFVVGWRIRSNAFELVYRQEGNQLIICDFAANEGALDASNGAVIAVLQLIHRIERAVPQLRLVRGLFIETLSNPHVNKLRERLARVLEGQGAVWADFDGEQWLTYPLPSKYGQRLIAQGTPGVPT